MTRTLILLVTGAALVGLLAGCGASERDWKDAEKSATAFLSAISEKRFEESWPFWDQSSPWGNVDKARYLNAMNESALKLPEMYDWHFTLERFKADSRTDMYRFKVLLTYRNGDPVRVAELAGIAAPNIDSEMLLTMNKRGDAWRVSAFRTFRVVDTGYKDEGYRSPKGADSLTPGAGAGKAATE